MAAQLQKTFAAQQTSVTSVGRGAGERMQSLCGALALPNTFAHQLTTYTILMSSRAER